MLLVIIAGLIIRSELTFELTGYDLHKFEDF